MSEKEKVMTVTLMRSDLYNAPAYTGAYLTLPADSSEIQDALYRARIIGNQPYQIVECLNMHGEELSFIPDNPSLAELNFLAGRISDLSVHDRTAFTGCAMMDDGIQPCRCSSISPRIWRMSMSLMQRTTGSLGNSISTTILWMQLITSHLNTRRKSLSCWTWKRSDAYGVKRKEEYILTEYM